MADEIDEVLEQIEERKRRDEEAEASRLAAMSDKDRAREQMYGVSQGARQLVENVIYQMNGRISKNNLRIDNPDVMPGAGGIAGASTYMMMLFDEGKSDADWPIAFLEFREDHVLAYVKASGQAAVYERQIDPKDFCDETVRELFIQQLKAYAAD